MNRLKSLFHVTVGFFAALGVLSATQGRLAHALPGATSPSTLVTDVNSLKLQVGQLQTTATKQAVQITALQGLVQALKGAPGGSGLTVVQATVLSKFTLEDSTGAANASGTELHLVGVNLHLEDGSGSTYDNAIDGSLNLIPGKSFLGLGNLIIGYNETQAVLTSQVPSYTSSGADVRTGSHNLILGAGNNYSSFGGAVSGAGNTITGALACAVGGSSNLVSGLSACAVSGTFNLVSGQTASTIGGSDNIASGLHATVTGGDVNIAGGELASVTGGHVNTASALESAVDGGYQNTASGSDCTVGGGAHNNAASGDVWLAGFGPAFYFGNGGH